MCVLSTNKLLLDICKAVFYVCTSLHPFFTVLFIPLNQHSCWFCHTYVRPVLSRFSLIFLEGLLTVALPSYHLEYYLIGSSISIFAFGCQYLSLNFITFPFLLYLPSSISAIPLADNFANPASFLNNRPCTVSVPFCVSFSRHIATSFTITHYFITSFQYIYLRTKD
jgi:hypothetical protein